MFHPSTPRWTRVLFGMLLLAGMLTTSAAQAGITHSEGGSVVETPGVPETDGTATVQIYWIGDTAARTSVLAGSPLAGYWLHDVGFALSRAWQVGDEHVALLEMETGAGTAAHTGYYGVSTKVLTSLDPDEFLPLVVRPIPVPVAAAGGGYVDLAWNRAQGAGPDAIAGYNVYRSTDGIAFTKLTPAAIADTTYRDATAAFGTTYQYAVALAYRGTPGLESAKLSANSAPVTPLDATPPDVPMLAAEPAFTKGTTNLVAWSNEAPSGAAAYFVECALDAAFTSLVGNSGWIADTTHTFADLADGRTYHFRVRSRDAATNASTYSEAVASRQDASAPASQLQTLAAFKASSTVNLEWSAADSLSGIASVQLYYAKDGGASTLYPGGPFTTSPIAFDASTTGGDGVYAFYTLATDAVANAETAPETPDATTIIDTQAPAVPALAALPAFTAGTARGTNWSSAAATGAIEYRVQASTADDFSTLASESEWIADSSFVFTDLADGTAYRYRVQSRDQAGNASGWSTLSASTQDASAPATAAAALPALTNDPTFDLAWEGTDTTSGLASIELLWSKDGGTFAPLAGGPFTTSPIAIDLATLGGDGVYAFSTRGTDAVGNIEAAGETPDATIVLDTSAPASPEIAALPSYSPGITRSLTWTAAEGAAFLAQVSTDPAFGTILAESGWITETSYTFTGLADAAMHHFRVRGRDAAGNASDFSAALATTQDATAPVTAAAALPAIASTPAFDITWTGSDAASGLAAAELWFSKDGGDFTLYPGGPFAASPIAFDAAQAGGDGSYRFYTRGVDAVGNRESAPEAADAETSIDTSAPGAPSIASLQTFSAGSAVALAWSDESATGAVEYRAEMSTDPSFASLAATSDWLAATAFTFEGLTDGAKYHFRVQARDAAANVTGWSGLQATTMDATAPTAALAALPAAGNDPHWSLSWTGDDATSGIANVDLYWSKDGAPYTLAAGSPFDASPIAFDGTSSGDGTYRFYIRARDHVGNLEAAPADPEASTTLDMTAPGTPAIAALPAFTAGTSRSIAWSDGSAAGATEYQAQRSLDPAFASIDGTSGWIASTTFTFEGLADGSKSYYRVQSRDALGNASAFGAAQSSTQDASAPASSIAALPALQGTLNLSLAWTGSDAASGLESIDLYYAKDGGPFVRDPNGPFTTSPIAFDAAAAGGEGAYAFYSIARDAIGNIEAAPASADAQTTLDTSAPTTPAIASLPAFRQGSALTLQWSDLGAAATAYRAQMSDSESFGSILHDTGWITSTQAAFTSLQDGHAYWFRVQARDAAENASAFSAAASTTMDATAPSSQLEALAGLGNAAQLALEWNGFDLTSGIAGVDLYYSRNGGAFTLHPASPFAASPIDFDAATTGGDGNYTFYVRARDGAGNLEPAPAAPDAQTRIDTTAPNTPVLASLATFTAGSTVNLSWTNQSASGAIDYLAEMSTDPSFASIAAQSSWIPATSYAFGSLDDGQTYWFRVRTRDAAQNESAPAAAQTTTLDDTAPASAVAALPSVTTTLAFGIAWTGSDATSGLAGVDLYYARDGGAYTLYPGGPFASNPIAFDASTTGGQGSYAFYTRARDRVNNRETAPGGPDAQTIVNTTATGTPTLASVPAFTAGTSRSLAWTPGANNATYQVQAATDAGFASIHAQTGWINGTSHTFEGLADGQTYWYRVRARSSLGIESAHSAAFSSTQDATAPTSQADALPALTTTSSFAVAWTATDATSGVTSVRLYVSRNGGAAAELSGGPFTSSPIAFEATAFGGDGTYTFYTRALDIAGNFEAAPATHDAATIVSTAAVGAPTLASVPAFSAGTSRSLAWSPGANNATYQVQAATDAGFASIHAQTGWIHSTSHTFEGLADGQTYWYRVRARNTVGIESGFSALVSCTQDATAPASQADALPAITTTPNLAITWTASDVTSGIAGVRLYVSRNGGAPAELLGGPFTSSPIAFDAMAFGGDGAYTFYTRALDAVGNLEPAPASADASTLVDTTAPAAPALASEPPATQGTSNTVAWSAVAGASEYLAQCAADAAFMTPVSSSGWITATTWNFTNLEPGTTYWYRVRARDAAGNVGDWSEAVSSTQSAGTVLAAGWNLISFNTQPADGRIDRVLGSIAGSYNIVRTYDQSAFLTYLPSLPVGMNDLQTMDALHGYWIYMTRTDTLTVGGTPVTAGTPIELRPGWNLAGYLPAAPMSPGIALASIEGSYALARGYESGAGYRTHYPSLPGLSDLQEMRTGQGYWLYMTAADQLVYGGLPKTSGTEPSIRGLKLPTTTVADAAAVPTVMDVWSTSFTLDGQPAPAGTVLEAYDTAGTLIGTATVKEAGRLPVLHLHGDVSITETDEGAIAGETITFQVRDLDMTLVQSKPFAWQRDAVQGLELEFVATESLLPRAFALAQNVPNPFNPTTRIEYAIPGRVDGQPLAGTHVDLRIFDIRGRVVRTLVGSRQAPGRYTVTWDGRDANGQSVPSGVYFYRLHTNEFTQSRKMMMVK